MKNGNQNENQKKTLSCSGLKSKFKKEVRTEAIFLAKSIVSDKKRNNLQLLDLRNVSVNDEWNRDLCVSYIGNL